MFTKNFHAFFYIVYIEGEKSMLSSEKYSNSCELKTKIEIIYQLGNGITTFGINELNSIQIILN